MGRDRTKSPALGRGFTLTELLIVIGIIAVLVSILLPAVNRVWESARRSTCASNLRQFGQAFKVYAQDNGELPRTTYHNGMGASSAVVQPKAFSGARCNNPIGTGNAGAYATDNAGADNLFPARNDVTSALFLLMRVQKLPPRIFICPSSRGSADTFEGESMMVRSNFTDRSNLSYSVALQYPWTYNNNGWGYYFGPDMKPDLPLMSDLNPGDSGAPKVYELALAGSGTDMRQGNSLNHARRGQNVLYHDGRVDWVQTPFAGVDRDNIFTRAPSSPPPTDQASDTTDPYGSRPPRHPADSLLLPTATSTGISAY